MRFSLVIPCYNEAANIPLLLEKCGELSSHPGVEILLVDNGSTDESQLVMSKLLPRYPACRSVRVIQNQGYGFGILAGLNEASGEFLGWTHADMQTNPCDALQGLKLFDEYGPNIFVKGRRYGRPISDIAFTVGMSAFETLLLGKRMWDINAQPTMFSRKFFKNWREPPYDFSLDLYAYYQARMVGMAVHRFPVLFSERAHGVSHWNLNWAAKRKFIRRTMDFSFQLRKTLKT